MNFPAASRSRETNFLELFLFFFFLVKTAMPHLTGLIGDK